MIPGGFANKIFHATVASRNCSHAPGYNKLRGTADSSFSQPPLSIFYLYFLPPRHTLLLCLGISLRPVYIFGQASSRLWCLPRASAPLQLMLQGLRHALLDLMAPWYGSIHPTGPTHMALSTRWHAPLPLMGHQDTFNLVWVHCGTCGKCLYGPGVPFCSFNHAGHQVSFPHRPRRLLCLVTYFGFRTVRYEIIVWLLANISYVFTALKIVWGS